nr:ABC transporter permease [Enterococcus sp. DIV0242_7C1]
MENKKVLNVSFLSVSSDALDDTIHSLNIVVWVLITVSGILAFIVLYNLTNINISERIRELSTIKVLGFYDNEVTMYVYRENIILTLIGIVIGCFFGKVVHGYVLTTVEVDMLMFSPTIHWISYFYSAVITMFFTLLVMVFMHRKLKKVNMIEALKSNE